MWRFGRCDILNGKFKVSHLPNRHIIEKNSTVEIYFKVPMNCSNFCDYQISNLFYVNFLPGERWAYGFQLRIMIYIMGPTFTTIQPTSWRIRHFFFKLFINKRFICILLRVTVSLVSENQMFAHWILSLSKGRVEFVLYTFKIKQY